MSIKVMSEVWELDLPSDEKIVLLAFADHADDGGECYPTLERVARKCGYSERSVRRKVSSLVAAGLLAEGEPFVGGRGIKRPFTVTPSAGQRLAPVSVKGAKLSKGDNQGTERGTAGVVKEDNGGISIKEEPSGTIKEPSTLTLVAEDQPPRRPPDGFDELWSMHRRGGKPAARKAYEKAVKKITHAELVQYLGAYLAEKKPGDFTAHLSTWLNQEYWEQYRELHPEHGKRFTGTARFY